MSTLSGRGLIGNMLGLGIFWGLSPVITRGLTIVGVTPVQIIVFSGLIVGFCLWVLQRFTDRGDFANKRLWFYGLGCAVFLNLPFGLSLYVITKIPLATYSIIGSTTPFFGYALALMMGLERANWRRILALIFGFLGSGLLLLPMSNIEPSAEISSFIITISFGMPLFYALYHIFAARMWPSGVGTRQVGVVESLCSGMIALPVLIFMMGNESLNMSTLGLIGLIAISGLWVIERLTFFNLIRNFGPISTVQAIYISTISGVIFGHYFFDEPIDWRIAVSAGLVIVALWLNARAQALILMSTLSKTP
jgi:drug/metabolite transporter (DMT)-like permease